MEPEQADLALVGVAPLLEHVVEQPRPAVGVAGGDGEGPRLVFQVLLPEAAGQERHALAVGVVDGHRALVDADRAGHGEHLLGVDEVTDGGGGALGRVLVVVDDQLQLAAVHAAAVVDGLEVGVGALPAVADEHADGARQRHVDAEEDVALGHAGLVTGGAGSAGAGSAGRGGRGRATGRGRSRRRRLGGAGGAAARRGGAGASRRGAATGGCATGGLGPRRRCGRRGGSGAAAGGGGGCAGGRRGGGVGRGRRRRLGAAARRRGRIGRVAAAGQARCRALGVVAASAAGGQGQDESRKERYAPHRDLHRGPPSLAGRRAARPAGPGIEVC